MFFQNFVMAILFLYFGSSAGFCERICTVPKAENCVAITFDDGPDPETTPAILAIPKEYKAHATFFVTGRNAEMFPEILREIARSKNEVGNHSFDHPDLLMCSDEQICAELDRTNSVIARIIPGYNVLVFRPPFSRIDGNIERIVEGRGMKNVIWSGSPGDWLDLLAKIIAERVLAAARPGAIFVMHDGRDPKSKIEGKLCHWNTVKALPEILEGLKKRGWQVSRSASSWKNSNYINRVLKSGGIGREKKSDCSFDPAFGFVINRHGDGSGNGRSSSKKLCRSGKDAK